MRRRRKLTIAVASGKGGTGKTLFATNLAVMAAIDGGDVALVDCDAEAPNDRLFFDGELERTDPVEVLSAVVDAETCTACGLCRDACAYGAIRILGESAMVFDELCHGCGVCSSVCAFEAITEQTRSVGAVETMRVDLGTSEETAGSLTVVTGLLDIGDVKTPQVIRAARDRAEQSSAKTLILDAPPGVACAAVAAVRGADVLLLVAEPTPFGLHDLELSARLADDMGIPVALVVNRSDSGAEDLDAWAAERGIPVLLHVPFSRAIAEDYARGELVALKDPEFAEWIACVSRSLRALAKGDALEPCGDMANGGAAS